MRMNKKALAVGALMLAIAWGAVAMAEQAAMKAKTEGACPMRVSGAKVNVVNIDMGVVIHVTADDAATVAAIKTSAAGLGSGHGGHSGCKHCGGAMKKQTQPESSCGHGESCGGSKEGVYACSMGDYAGPMTKDGRCPKCGMSLSPKN